MISRRQWQPRHSVLAVIFLACIVSHLDRMAMSVAIPYIAADFELTPVAMGAVMSIFFASYAISQIPGGILADRFGVRRVGSVALLWWSGFTAVTGAASNLTHMLFARLFFGFGEGVFPTSAFKAVALWFPRRERGTANAVMLSAGQIGATLAPLIVVPIIAIWGWRGVFYSLSIPGIVVAFLFWKVIKDRPTSVDEDDEHDVAETASATAPKVSFMAVLKQQNMLRFVLAYFFFDIAYWGLTSWLPTYLVQARGFSMAQMGIAAALPQFAGFLGSLLGGWLSDRYFRDNRRIPIIAAQLLSALWLYLTFTTTSGTLVVVYQILAGFCLNFFFTSFWAVPMTTVPVKQMGLTTGIINTAGQSAAFIAPILVGYLVGVSGGSYDLTFMVLIACLIISCAVVISMTRLQPQTADKAVPIS